MPTDIQYLKNLERDLTKIAENEERFSRSAARATRRARWRGWTTAAAMLVLVAFVIGLTQLGGSQSNQFSTVGSAVNGAVGRGSLGFDTGSGGGSGTSAPVPEIPPETAAPTQGGKTDLTKIVRDGSISLSIERGQFQDVATEVVAIARENQGSLLSSSTSQGNSGTFTLRIPAANFDRAMVSLAALGAVDTSEIHGQDVTAQYLDAKAHLKIYLARRKFLFGLMSNATTTGESLTLARELQDVQLQIDQITGQLRYLNNQVSMSTIKVDVTEPGATPVDQPADIENPSLGRAFARGVQGLLSVLGAILIGLGYLVPLVVLGGAVYGVVWLVRRRRQPGDGT
jgi:hypothetical protein